MVQLQSRKPGSLSVVPPRAHSAPQTAVSHAVHFYEDDSAFLDQLSELIGAELGSGCACVVIGTEAHRAGLAERLEQFGINISFAAATDRYIALDAEKTLEQFIRGDLPDRELFFQTIEPVLVKARAAMGRRKGSVTAFGEMVAVLCDQDRYQAAVELERFWNELVKPYGLTLRCAYPMHCFAGESEHPFFEQVCAEHTATIPTEDYTSLRNETERLRMVSSLQQKALLVSAVVDDREKEIAQRKEVEERLRRSEEFARHVVENSDDCVKLLDLDGRVEYISPPGMRALEIDDLSDIRGCSWLDFWRAEDRPRAETALAAAREGSVGSFQGECSTRRGTRKSWDVKITPMRNTGGEIEGLISVSRDITELRRAQQMAIQAEKLAAAGRMAATIAHEINNPLEAVTNFIYLARTTPGLPDDVSHHLEIADRELSRVAQIAQKTLGFYRDTSRNRWLNVGELIHDVLLVYERKLRNKHIQTSSSIDPGLKIYVKQGEIKQALSNLIANAIDALATGGRIWIRARASRHWTNGMGSGVRITLADNGSGMPPEVQQRIFVPFFTTKAEVGTGIGLWVTKSIIDQYGGYLRFRSRQGKRPGTAMSFFVPNSRHEEVAVSS